MNSKLLLNTRRILLFMLGLTLLAIHFIKNSFFEIFNIFVHLNKKMEDHGLLFVILVILGLTIIFIYGINFLYMAKELLNIFLHETSICFTERGIEMIHIPVFKLGFFQIYSLNLIPWDTITDIRIVRTLMGTDLYLRLDGDKLVYCSFNTKKYIKKKLGSKHSGEIPLGLYHMVCDIYDIKYLIEKKIKT